MSKENMYINKFGGEYLTLRQSCKIWVSPSYSTLSKLVAKKGYKKAVYDGDIPKYRKVGNRYMFRISDILEYLDSLEKV